MNKRGHGEAAYGTWPSPITAAHVARSGVDFWHVVTTDDGTYWRESRPAENGRGVIVRHRDGRTEDVTPADYDVLSLAYESGGGSFAVIDDIIFFVNFEDQRVYRQSDDGSIDPITPEPDEPFGKRYGDIVASPDGNALVCVREDHDAVATGDAEDPRASLVQLDPDGGADPTVLAASHDFYAAPRASPTGDRLAYIAWDHPRMPWNGTELHVADRPGDGTLANDRVVLGGPDESVLQPSWAPDGTLHAVTDRAGWWNLHRRTADGWRPYRDEGAEHAVPPWLLGLSNYAFLADGRVAVVRICDGQQSLALFDVDGDRREIDVPYRAFGGEYCLPVVRSDGTSVWVVAGGPRTPDRLVRWTPGGGHETIVDGGGLELDEAYLAVPEHRTFRTRDGAVTHAWVYEPTNPGVRSTAAGPPPLIVRAPGGPTLGSHPGYTPGIQYFTSRGFAVAEVNYRGSTGYGRPYREALEGNWGTTDVEDCLDVARGLVAEGSVDPERLVIRGLSAGGFIALAALARSDVLAGGTSINGIADLEEWANTTHKFESRYADTLIGPYPETAATYRARSPLNQVDAIDDPVLLLQGEDDRIVPASQAEAMADALDANGVTNELHRFPEEGHLFVKEATISRAHELELSFYRDVLNIEPGTGSPD